MRIVFEIFEAPEMVALVLLALVAGMIDPHKSGPT